MGKKIQKKTQAGWLEKKWVIPVILVSVIFILYAPTLSYKFMPMDDLTLIVYRTKWLGDISNLPDVFTKGVFERHNQTGSYYRPMLELTFMIDALTGKGSPVLYHLTNILLHAGASILCFFLFLKILRNRLLSFFLSLFYAVLPVSVAAVAWITGRNDTLLAVFVFSASIFFVNYIHTRKILNLLLFLLFYLLTLLTKESAIVYPVIILLMCFLIMGKKSRRGWWLIVSLMISVTVGWFLIKNTIIPTSADLSLFDWGKIIGNSMLALLTYLGKVIFPFNQSILPVMEDTSVIPGIIALSIILFLSIRYGLKDKRIALFGIAWFLLFFAIPVSVATFDGMGLHYEHRMYIPLFGLLLFLSQINLKIKRLPVYAIMLLLICSAITLARCPAYKSSFAFSEHAIRESPSIPISFNLLGVEYKNLKQPAEALQNFDKALEIRPGYPAAWFNKGSLLNDLSRYDEGVKAFTTGLQTDSVNAGAWYGLGNSYYGLNEYPKAIEAFSRAIRLYPDYDDAWLNRGSCYAMLGQTQEALEGFSRAAGLDPGNANAYNNRANVWSDLGEYQKALQDIDKALSLKPGEEDFIVNRNRILEEMNQTGGTISGNIHLTEAERQLLEQAYTYYREKNYGEALKLFQQLYEEAAKSRDEAEALSHYNNMGLCYLKLNNLSRAETIFKDILNSYPDYEKAVMNLALLCTRRGDNASAIRYYERALEINPGNHKAAAELEKLGGQGGR